MSIQDTVSQESHPEDDLPWQEIAENHGYIVVFQRVIDEIIMVNNGLPEQLLEVANSVSATSSRIDSVKNHREDFEQLIADASCLVAVLWQSYNKSKFPTIWPPPELGYVIDDLIEMMRRIYALIRRKSQSFIKRILVGFFGIRDLGKFKKYRRKLGSVAKDLESQSNNINISKVLLEVFNGQTQPRDGDSEFSEEPEGDSSVKKGVKKRTAEQEPIAERSRLPKVKNRAKDDSEDERVEQGLAEDKIAQKNRARKGLGGEPEPKGTNSAKKNTNFGEVAPESEDRGKAEKQRTRHKESNEDVEEHSSRTNNAAQSKTKKAPSQAYDDEENMPGNPIGAKGPSNKKKKPVRVATPKKKVKSTPLPPQSSISGFSFSNGAGTMTNTGVGNIHNSTISDVGNDDSEKARRKRV